jgi:spore coat polysaccharide biosynthesis predicted glycosyltransferase SpsG
LQNSGFKIEEFDDLNNIAEKKLGKLVLDRYIMSATVFRNYWLMDAVADLSCQTNALL